MSMIMSLANMMSASLSTTRSWSGRRLSVKTSNSSVYINCTLPRSDLCPEIPTLPINFFAVSDAHASRRTQFCNKRGRFSAPFDELMTAVVVDPALHLGDRIVRERDGLPAVAALVFRGSFEFRLRGAEALERGVHPRLIGRGAAGDESGGEQSDESQGRENSTSGHSKPSFNSRRADAPGLRIAYLEVRYATPHDAQMAPSRSEERR